MTATVGTGLPTGLLLALLQLPVTWLAIALYERTARRHVDPLADRIRRQSRSTYARSDPMSTTPLPRLAASVTEFSGDAQTMSLVAFTAVATITLLLCVMTGPDRDDLDEFYTGYRSLSPLRNGLAIAGDYISAATVLGTTGVIALCGYDGVVLA